MQFPIFIGNLIISYLMIQMIHHGISGAMFSDAPIHASFSVSIVLVLDFIYSYCIILVGFSGHTKTW
jgi:hypothetical protein